VGRRPTRRCGGPGHRAIQPSSGSLRHRTLGASGHHRRRARQLSARSVRGRCGGSHRSYFPDCRDLRGSSGLRWCCGRPRARPRALGRWRFASHSAPSRCSFHGLVRFSRRDGGPLGRSRRGQVHPAGCGCTSRGTGVLDRGASAPDPVPRTCRAIAVQPSSRSSISGHRVLELRCSGCRALGVRWPPCSLAIPLRAHHLSLVRCVRLRSLHVHPARFGLRPSNTGRPRTSVCTDLRSRIGRSTVNGSRLPGVRPFDTERRQ
jgi:hypothetical protein